MAKSRPDEEKHQSPIENQARNSHNDYIRESRLPPLQLWPTADQANTHLPSTVTSLGTNISKVQSNMTESLPLIGTLLALPRIDTLRRKTQHSPTNTSGHLRDHLAREGPNAGAHVDLTATRAMLSGVQATLADAFDNLKPEDRAIRFDPSGHQAPHAIEDLDQIGWLHGAEVSRLAPGTGSTCVQEPGRSEPAGVKIEREFSWGTKAALASLGKIRGHNCRFEMWDAGDSECWIDLSGDEALETIVVEHTESASLLPL